MPRLRSAFQVVTSVFVVLLSSGLNLSAQSRPNAKELLGKMTLEEKAAQLSQLPGIPLPEFIDQNGMPEDALRKYGAGSVLWVSEPKEINRWQHIAVDETRLHILSCLGLM